MANKHTSSEQLESPSISHKTDLPLFRMVYSSRVRYVALYSYKLLASLSRQSVKNNQQYGITGVLCFGNGYFLQYVEGTEEVLTNLKNKLLKDSRHYAFSLSDFSQIEERVFRDISMGVTLVDEKFHAADCAINDYIPFTPKSWTLHKQLSLIQQVQEGRHTIVDKDFTLNKIDALLFASKLVMQLIRGNITKQQSLLFLSIVGFCGMVTVLFLFAFKIVVI